MMNANSEMLNHIYQNAQMGQDTLCKLLRINDDEEFQTLLDSQFSEYKKIFDTAEQLQNEHGNTAKGLCTFAKLSTFCSLHMETMRDRSASHISEMLIEGSTLGVIDITKNLKKYRDADPEILSLGEKLLAFEQQNIEECKRFLS